MSFSFDVAVVGAGIVGLATGLKLQEKYPGLSVAIVEKEGAIAAHQTGHNSGVIHSGLYYRPGSLKAGLCLSGYDMLVAFCREHGLRHEICGKVVVATREEELPALEELHRRGTANGVPGLRLLSPSDVKEIEPHAACIRGMHVPSTGIVDYREVAEAYARVFQSRGGMLLLRRKVTGVKADGPSSLRVFCTGGPISARALINCGGLYSDRVAEDSGMKPPCRIVPFRGEYYRIRPERGTLVKNLIYPVPDPRFPFLGVHFTRMVDGKVEAGPNAVLAFAREGYGKTSIAPLELLETLRYDGFWRLVRRYWKNGMGEMARSCSKVLFAKALRRLIPEIQKDDLLPGGAGVRAQALGHDGKLLDDFVVMEGENMVHVLNAPSPAATSSLAIGAHIVGIAGKIIGGWQE
ncbi:MAG: L-2-hydroxyglutarate oxidase [Desulfobacteraceae bacterium]|nr:L-2-hydroxyglutarate oxidase [Desulfobacteraceae bacterium]